MTDALVHRRVGDLLAAMREQWDGISVDDEPLFVKIICDKCGAVEDMPSYLPEAWEWLLNGWRLSETWPYDDRCPRCR